jgi:hypothetical protein
MSLENVEILKRTFTASVSVPPDADALAALMHRDHVLTTDCGVEAKDLPRGTRLSRIDSGDRRFLAIVPARPVVGRCCGSSPRMVDAALQASVSLFGVVVLHATGIMSLVSLISSEHPELWRLAFGISGGLGAAELVLSLIYARDEPVRERRIQRLLALTLPLYLLIVAVAIHPSLAPDVGIHLKPLETEAIVVSVLFFLGINFGWLLFMEPAYPVAPDQKGDASTGGP